MIESPKLVEFDLLDIDRDEQRLRARNRGAGSYHLELAPSFESAMSFDREFEQVVHGNIGCAEKKGVVE